MYWCSVPEGLGSTSGRFLISVAARNPGSELSFRDKPALVNL